MAMFWYWLNWNVQGVGTKLTPFGGENRYFACIISKFRVIITLLGQVLAPCLWGQVARASLSLFSPLFSIILTFLYQKEWLLLTANINNKFNLYSNW